MLEPSAIFLFFQIFISLYKKGAISVSFNCFEQEEAEDFEEVESEEESEESEEENEVTITSTTALFFLTCTFDY